jgi:hypothetical protein
VEGPQSPSDSQELSRPTWSHFTQPNNGFQSPVPLRTTSTLEGVLDGD